MKIRLLLIYNIKAGSVKTTRRLNKIRRVIENEGFEVKDTPLHKVTAIKPLISECDAILIAGGDGSVNVVADHLLREEIENPPPLAVLPGGTANDIYHQIYKGCKINDILAVIKKGNITRLDIGQANNRYFVNIAAAGMFSDVAYLTPRTVKRLFGTPAYYIHALIKVMTYRPFKLTIKANGEYLEEEVLVFLVLNGSQAAGLFIIAPDAALNDGKLHLLALKKSMTIFQVVKLLYRVLCGITPDQPGVIYLTAKNMSLQFPESHVLVIDGEKGPLPPVEIKLLPARLPFYTP